MKKHIGIDARMYGLENAGIGRYIINLIGQISLSDTENKYTIFLQPKYARSLKFPKNFRKITANFKHYSLEEQLKFPKLIEKQKVDLMHFPHFNVPLLYNKPFVVTIHDLLWHKTKGLSVTSLSPLKYVLKYGAYRAVVNHALEKAKHIIVPSNFVKNDVVKYGGEESKITTTYEGVDKQLPKSKEASFKLISKKFKLTTPFVVYTGSAYPHKNLKVLIDAIKLHQTQSDSQLKLVIISSRSIFLDHLNTYVKKHKLSKLIIFTGYLPDTEVKSIYKNALCLVHPSLSEGFGLTGLEAMSVGLPVISSPEGSLKEVYDKAALYIDPKSSFDISAKIDELHEDKSLRDKYIEEGRERVKKFSWKTMTKQTLQVYDKAVDIKK